MEQASHQLRLAGDARDEEALRRALHTLKGSALALGVRRVADAAVQWEHAGFDAAAEVGRAMRARLEHELAAAAIQIRRRLAG